MCTLLARLNVGIDTTAGPTACWPWRKGCSRSGYREVDYPALRISQPRRLMLRINRVVLLLKTAPGDCPILPDEAFIAWVLRANQYYRDKDASHTCDQSRCCNPDHLEWQPHSQNCADGARRKRQRQAHAA